MITIEGNDITIIEMNPEKSYIEVVDGETLFRGRLVEATCENYSDFGLISAKYSKIILKDYTAERLKKGYYEKKLIKKALNKIIEDNDMLYMDMDENVDVIYDKLESKGCFK